MQHNEVMGLQCGILLLLLLLHNAVWRAHEWGGFTFSVGGSGHSKNTVRDVPRNKKEVNN